MVRDTVELVICVLHCVVLMLIDVGGVTRSLSRGMASSLGILSSASLVQQQCASHTMCTPLVWPRAVELNVIVLMNTPCLLRCGKKSGTARGGSSSTEQLEEGAAALNS